MIRTLIPNGRPDGVGMIGNVWERRPAIEEDLVRLVTSFATKAEEVERLPALAG